MEAALLGREPGCREEQGRGTQGTPHRWTPCRWLFSNQAALCPHPHPRAATQELALLISRMQANADQVERDILETQKKLQQVRPQG